MGKHKEWRKLAKKMRRKKIRSTQAQKRDAIEKEEEEKRKMSPNYEKRAAEEEAILMAAKEAEMKELEEKLKKWEEEEERVREETKLRDSLLKELEEKNEKQRIEKMEAVKQLVEEEEEKKKRISDFLNNFATGVIDTLPDDMLVPSETQPGKEICPFFNKVAACRFRDTCSRNHIRPTVSKTLLFPGFYSHCSMSQIGHAEYDTDMALEYDEKETYAHFLEFYQDIRCEFEKYGHLTRLLVCSNREPHLRGNVYASYATERDTMTAFLKFNGRYYAGRVVNCLFVNISNWKSAICGLSFKQKCPKGDACNFLHIFKDPGPPFYKPPFQDRCSSVEWSWSVSPEDREHGDETIIAEARKTNKRKKRGENRSDQHRSSRSSERKIANHCTKWHHRSRSKENTGCSSSSNIYKKRHIQQNNKCFSSKSGSRSRSKDRNKRKYSDNRYRDESDNRRSKRTEKGRKNSERMRSLSPQRDNKRSREYKHENSADRNKIKYERKRKRSSSSSTKVESSSSDNESTSSEGKTE